MAGIVGHCREHVRLSLLVFRAVEQGRFTRASTWVQKSTRMAVQLLPSWHSFSGVLKKKIMVGGTLLPCSRALVCGRLTEVASAGVKSLLTATVSFEVAARPLLWMATRCACSERSDPLFETV